MLSKMFGSMRRRVGPVGLSLAAAALTATVFAGVSMAAKDDKGSGDDSAQQRNGDQLHGAPGFPGPGGPPMIEELSDSDRAAIEEFQKCLEDNGAPARPEPESFDPENPPEPPTDADRKAMKKAFEACKDKLPEGAPAFGGPGGPGGPGCGPPPGGDGATIPAPPSAPQGEGQSAPQSGSSGAPA